MLSLISAIITGVSSVIGAIIGAFGSKWWESKNLKINKRYILNKSKEAHRCLVSLRQQTKAEHVALLLFENGSVRDFETSKFISLIDEDYLDNSGLSFTELQRYRVPNDFKQQVKLAIDSVLTTFVVSEMEDSLMKRLSQMVGVTDLIFVPVFEIDRKFWFILLRMKNLDLSNPATTSSIELSKFKLAKIIEEAPEAVS